MMEMGAARTQHAALYAFSRGTVVIVGLCSQAVQQSKEHVDDAICADLEKEACAKRAAGAPTYLARKKGRRGLE